MSRLTFVPAAANTGKVARIVMGIRLVATLCFSCLVWAAMAQSGSDRCDAALLPQITIAQLSTTERVAYLSLITESNYEQARSSGALNIIIEGLPVGASFQQFDERRRQFLSETRLRIDRSEARAMFRQSLTDSQLAAWTSCMTSDVPGVRIVMRSDNEEGVTAEVHYVEAAGRSKRFHASVTGGRAVGGRGATAFVLDHGGSHGILLMRQNLAAKIRVLVNGPNMTDTAVSLPPPATPPPPPPPPACEQPILLSRNAPVTADRFPDAAFLITDGTDRNWNSLASAPQKIEIDLGGPRRVRHINFNPEQTPAGFTQHRITGRKPDGTSLLLGEANGNTISGGIFTVLVAPPMGDGVRFIRVETVSSPSSVSWREIEIFGCQ